MAPTVPVPRHLPRTQEPVRQVSERAGGMVQASLPTGGMGQLSGAIGRRASAERGMLDPIQGLLDKSVAIAEGIAAMDADNRLAEIEHELRAEMLTLKGKDAIGATDRYMREYEERSKEVFSGLFTPRATHAATQSYTSRGRSFQNAAESYENQQFNIHADETERKSIANLVHAGQQTAASRDDDKMERYRAIAAGIGNRFKTRANRLGQDPEATKHDVMNQVSKMHLGSIANMLKMDDVEGVREFFNGNDGEVKKAMLPEHRAQAEELIGRETRRVKINLAIDELMAMSAEEATTGEGAMTSQELFGLAREIHAKDPDRDDIVRGLKVRLRERSIAAKEQQLGVQNRLMDFVSERQPRSRRELVALVGADQWEAIPPETRKKATDYISTLRGRRQRDVNFALGLQVRRNLGMLEASLAAYRMVNEDIESKGTVTPETERKLKQIEAGMHPKDAQSLDGLIARKREQAKKAATRGTGSGRVAVLGERVVQAKIDQYVAEALKDFPKKRREEMGKALELEIRSRFGDTDGTAGELARIIIDVHGSREEVSRGWLRGETEVPKAALTPKQREEAGLPPAGRERMQQQAQAELKSQAQVNTYIGNRGKQLPTEYQRRQIMNAFRRGDRAAFDAFVNALPDK